MKKIISLFLATLMVLSIITVAFSMNAFASYENTYSNTGNQRVDIVAVARTQIGYCEGSNNNNKYGSYCGNNYAPWCAYFIVWCARQAGIPSNIIKTTGWACASDLGVTYYSRNSYTPKSGDLIFFDYASTSASWDHVGLVDSVDSTYVTVIEGNSNDRVQKNRYTLKNSSIKGYGVPNYKTTHSHSYSRYYLKSHPHQIKMKCNCGDYYMKNEYKKLNNCTLCNHKHSYTGTRVYESAHPHRISQRCVDYNNCGGFIWLDQYKKVSSCSQCYPPSYIATNFKLKAANYIQAYSDVSCTTKAGQIYSNDVLTIKRIYTSKNVAYCGCKWDNSNGYKYIYFKISDLKIRMTKYVDAFSNQSLTSKCGRAYTGDIITSVAMKVNSSNTIVVSGYCAWNNNGSKYIYMKATSIY